MVKLSYGYPDSGHRFSVTAPIHLTAVTPSASATGTGAGSTLPVTGTPLALLSGAGATPLAAGTAALLLLRRRTTH